MKLLSIFVSREEISSSLQSEVQSEVAEFSPSDPPKSPLCRLVLTVSSLELGPCDPPMFTSVQASPQSPLSPLSIKV